MRGEPVENLVKIGFSEYEAKAYVALLRESPVTGYQLSKLSGVPRSMIYEVVGKLASRGAAMTLRVGNTNKYAPVAAGDFLDQLGREHEELISSLKGGLTALATVPDLEYVWNIEGHENIIAKAGEMIDGAEDGIYLAILPDTFPDLEAALARALGRGVRVVLYTTEDVFLPGAQIAVAHVAVETLSQARGLGLILVVDRGEVLIGEWLAGAQARASWTGSPLLVFLAEHHLRTDLYLPQILALLGDEALAFIQEEDRELFARALESHIEYE
jgi:Cd2+/Zn2+-exporting ATPase